MANESVVNDELLTDCAEFLQRIECG